MPFPLRQTLLVGALFCACAVLQVQAATTVTSTFAPTQVVQGTTLLVNGMGTRYKAIFKVYDLALYTQSKVSTPEALLALAGPKRLNFVALRDVPGTDLGLAFIKGLNSNSSPELVQKHTASSTRLIDIFSGKPRLVAGDTFAMEYVPGKGTTFFIQGQAQGAPVGDAEFFGMVLKIWVGPAPADFKLKDALLGQ
ncbi:MAG: hypothetical protein A3E00_10770 [Curvibacter sp. RIFCSPHIGHO2_12_FULL_63_18]|nr:MAG: hypothetical protein A2037_05180 [Curvibacter sp. GWA2_63_95]OGP06945.1 MAG: hypothetical protein A3E00_10770 [Curvibacter sp. RIFCSPHIGHO2_12_FULL_63_18]